MAERHAATSLPDLADAYTRAMRAAQELERALVRANHLLDTATEVPAAALSKDSAQLVWSPTFGRMLKKLLSSADVELTLTLQRLLESARVRRNRMAHSFLVDDFLDTTRKLSWLDQTHDRLILANRMLTEVIAGYEHEVAQRGASVQDGRRTKDELRASAKEIEDEGGYHDWPTRCVHCQADLEVEAVVTHRDDTRHELHEGAWYFDCPRCKGPNEFDLPKGSWIDVDVWCLGVE